MTPEISDLQKKRAYNLIWNAAADYGFTPDFKFYTADGTAVGTFSVTNGEGGVSTVNGIAPDGDGDVQTTVSSVSDLGLTVGSATISDAYTALASKQVLICPASDFAVGELPLSGGNRQTDGTIEIVKGDLRVDKAGE